MLTIHIFWLCELIWKILKLEWISKIIGKLCPHSQDAHSSNWMELYSTTFMEMRIFWNNANTYVRQVNKKKIFLNVCERILCRLLARIVYSGRMGCVFSHLLLDSNHSNVELITYAHIHNRSHRPNTKSLAKRMKLLKIKLLLKE